MRTGNVMLGLLILSMIVFTGCTEQYQKQPQQNPVTPAPSKEKIIFREDFEEYKPGDIPSDRWLLLTVAKGSPNDYKIVSVEGNQALMIQLRGYRQITDILAIKGIEIGNFSMSFRIHEVHPYDNVPALVFRFSEEGYYLLTYGEYGKKPGTAILYRVRDGKPETILEKNLPVKSLQDGRWHEFRITANGTKITWEIDGMRMFSVEDNAFRTGMLGFANSDGSLGRYLVDDVIISEV